MELLGIGLFLLIMFVITWVVIAGNAPNVPIQPLPKFDWERNTPFSERMLEDKVKSLKLKNECLSAELEYIKRSCRSHHQPPFMGCNHCCGAQVKYYAQRAEEQKLADMVSKAQVSAKQLLKDLTA